MSKEKTMCDGSVYLPEGMFEDDDFYGLNFSDRLILVELYYLAETDGSLTAESMLRGEEWAGKYFHEKLQRLTAAGFFVASGAGGHLPNYVADQQSGREAFEDPDATVCGVPGLMMVARSPEALN